MIPAVFLFFGLACHCGSEPADSDSPPGDSHPPADSGETSTPGETGETGETGDTSPPPPGDLNGDGLPDLILAGYATTLQSTDFAETVRIHLGTEDGFETEPSQELEGYGTRKVLADDLDQDGHLDLVLVNNRIADDDYEAPSYVYWGEDGTYSTERRTELPCKAANDGELADVDGDGFTDVILACYKGGASYVYSSSLAGIDPSPAVTLPVVRARDVLVEDLNGDGFLDLAFACEQDDQGSYQASSLVILGSEQGFGEDDVYRLPTIGAKQVLAEDLDQDGHLDLLFVNHEGDGELHAVDSYLYQGSADGWSEERRVALPTLGASDAAIADLNGDGLEDLVFANWCNGDRFDVESTIYWNSPDGFDPDSSVGLPTLGAQRVRVADFDLDGHPDVLLPTFCTDGEFPPEARLFWGSAAGPDAENFTTLEPGGIRGVTVADADQDGWPDIVFGGYNSPCHVTAEESSTYRGGPDGLELWQRFETPVIYGAPVVVGVPVVSF